jgi:hypothetical protein
VLRVQANFYVILPLIRIGRPSLKFYEGPIFALSTFFRGIFIFGAGARGLQRLINAYFAGFPRHFIAAPGTCKVTPLFDARFTPCVRRPGFRFLALNAGQMGRGRMCPTLDANLGAQLSCRKCGASFRLNDGAPR